MIEITKSTMIAMDVAQYNIFTDKDDTLEDTIEAVLDEFGGPGEIQITGMNDESLLIGFDGCICTTPLPEYLEKVEVMSATAKYWPRSRKYEVEISVNADVEE